MIAQVFALVQLVLAALGLWDQFLAWSDAKRLADAEANTQARNGAVDAEKGAKDESEFDKAQDDITSHLPH